VDPNDPGEIAREVKNLLLDPVRRAAVAGAGLERVRRYSWERCARTTLDVLERVAAERGSAT
jgi:glycosyltransferase involved in cell wall biosynthesis